MPQLSSQPLVNFCSDILSRLKLRYGAVDCRVEKCSDTTRPPCNQTFAQLGQLLYIVPESVQLQEASRMILGGKILATVNEFHVVSDGKPSDVLRISLETSNASVPTWRQILRDYFDEKLGGSNWEMLCLETSSSSGTKGPTSSIHLLRASRSTECLGAQSESDGGKRTSTPQKISMLLAPISRRIVAGTTKLQNGVDGKKRKVVLKRVPKQQPQSAALPPIARSTNSTNGVSEGNGVSADSVDRVVENGTLKRKESNGGLVGKMAAMFNGSCSRRGSRESLNNSAAAVIENGGSSTPLGRNGVTLVAVQPKAAAINGVTSSDDDTSFCSALTSVSTNGSLVINNVAGDSTPSTTTNNGITSDSAKTLGNGVASDWTPTTTTNNSITSLKTSTDCADGDRTLTKTSASTFSASDQPPSSDTFADCSNGGIDNSLKERLVDNGVFKTMNGFTSVTSQAKSLPKTSVLPADREIMVTEGHSDSVNGVFATTVAEIADSRPNGAHVLTAAAKPLQAPIASVVTTAKASPIVSKSVTPEDMSTFSVSSPSLNSSEVEATSSTAAQRIDNGSIKLSNGDGDLSIHSATLSSTNSSGSNTTSTETNLNSQYERSSAGSGVNGIITTTTVTSTTTESNLDDDDPAEDETLLLSYPVTVPTTENGENWRRPTADDDDDSEALGDLSLQCDDFSYATNTSELFDRAFVQNSVSTANAALSAPNTATVDVGATSSQGYTSAEKNGRSLNISTFQNGGTSISSVVQSTTKPPIFPSPATPKSSALVSSRAASMSRDGSAAPSGAAVAVARPEMVRGMEQMPVVVLQQVLAHFSFDELCTLRRVHPHWDELCGQLLNSGYYQLIHAADRLLTDCQRRVHAEKYLSQPIKALTNLQVHVLNPVDVLRAAIDEGVVCFPYGLILDKAFELLDRIEFVIRQREEVDEKLLSWERLAEYSRRAQIHHRTFVEPEVERRMAEVYKLSAAQRLHRLDSFFVEASVNKLEKETEKAKDDMRWEIDQLKAQNQQLKKDNRELKQTCLKMDARIDTLERKFKTMARLLQ